MKRREVIGECELWCGDCVEVLGAINGIDAIVADVPYGIGEAAGKNKSRGNVAVAKDYGNASWDDEPLPQTTIDFFRAKSRWQIIFGGNYYSLPPTSCWLVWDKLNGDNDFADCELAWTNMKKAVRRIQYRWNGMIRQNNEPRGDHPTQKPVGVMDWCIMQLPADAKTICDPTMGSGTTGVSCINMGRRFIGIERDETYFSAALRRIEAAYRQPRLFAEPAVTAVQEALL